MQVLKRIIPAIIEADVYYSFPQEIPFEGLNKSYKIFTKYEKSGIRIIDKWLKGSTKCYAYFINEELAHISFIFKKKLLTRQLGEENVITAGNSLTIGKFRGKGLYTAALRQILSDVDIPVIIYVSATNIASVKGIEKAGFEKKYSFRMMRFLGLKLWCKKNG